MKATVCFLVLLFLLTANSTVHAQARKLTSRIVNPDNTLKNPNNPPAAPPPVPQRPAISATPAPVPAVAVPEKTKEQKDEMLRKTIEFQKQRALGGAPTAQYDLGMRYLTGDGVEKDLTLAQKWIGASATNGNSQAIKKLEELKKADASEK